MPNSLRNARKKVVVPAKTCQPVHLADGQPLQNIGFAPLQLHADDILVHRQPGGRLEPALDMPPAYRKPFLQRLQRQILGQMGADIPQHRVQRHRARVGGALHRLCLTVGPGQQHRDQGQQPLPVDAVGKFRLFLLAQQFAGKLLEQHGQAVRQRYHPALIRQPGQRSRHVGVCVGQPPQHRRPVLHRQHLQRRRTRAGRQQRALPRGQKQQLVDAAPQGTALPHKAAGTGPQQGKSVAARFRGRQPHQPRSLKQRYPAQPQRILNIHSTPPFSRFWLRENKNTKNS